MIHRHQTTATKPMPVIALLGGFLLALFGTAGPASQAMAADAAFCSNYAQSAINMFRAAKAQNCPGLKYPVWSDDFQHHYRWCLKTPANQVQDGTRLRQQQMQGCGGQGLPQAGRNPEPEEVILYEGPDFVGQSAAFRVGPGDRWVSGHINNLPWGRVGSIRVGSNAAIATFNGMNFTGKQIRDRLCKAADSYRNAGDAIYNHDDVNTLPCKWVSFIVFRRNTGLAGVLFHNLYADGNSLTDYSQFLPVPPKTGMANNCLIDVSFADRASGDLRSREIGFVDYPSHNRTKIMNAGVKWQLARPAQAWADLFAAPNCQGQFVRLPGPGNQKADLDLKQHWPHGKIESVRIHWAGPNDAQGTITSVGTMVQPIIPMPQGQPKTANQGTGTAAAVTGMIASGNQIGATDEIRGRDVLGIYADRMEFRVHYVLSPNHPMPVYGGAWFKTATGSAGSYKPVTITQAGLGHYDIAVHRTAGMVDPREVEFFIHEGGQSPFLSKSFEIE